MNTSETRENLHKPAAKGSLGLQWGIVAALLATSLLMLGFAFKDEFTIQRFDSMSDADWCIDKTLKTGVIPSGLAVQDEKANIIFRGREGIRPEFLKSAIAECSDRYSGPVSQEWGRMQQKINDRQPG